MMTIAPDKIAHLRAGALVAAAAAVVYVLLFTAAMPFEPLRQWVPLGALPLFVAQAATVAGFIKEKADALDNAQLGPVHEVSVSDALHTAAPGWLLAAVIAVVLSIEVW